jgi:mono/diheme cytochrome c family protein
MSNAVSLALIIIAGGLLATWVLRAVGRRRGILKWLAIGFSGLLSAAIAGITILAAIGLARLEARTAPIPVLEVSATPAQVARGRAIADSFCSACHSVTGLLTGGRDLGKHLPVPVGSFFSANLTPGGPLRHWSDGQIFRAVRNAVDADGNWMTIMSYTNAGHLSDADIIAVIAYLRSVPAAGAPDAQPLDRFNLLGLVMLGAGLLPTGHPVTDDTIIAPPKGPTMAWGAYLLSYQDCRECHGADLSGGVAGQMAPLGPDLNLVKQWSTDEFISTLRGGVDPTGHPLSEEMPWRPIGRMDDDDLTAIYTYLTQMPDQP